ncbi:hypothetical protein Tco_1238967 [Tanacetum coccineum]
MTAKDVKALAFKHNIPLDLHPVALTAEWTMDKLADDFIGLYEQYFEFSGVRVPFSTLLLAVLDHFVTMSEYLRFPFLDGATIEQGDALSARDVIASHTTGPLPVNQSLPKKTARMKEDVDDAGTAESREDEHVSVPPHDSANTTHNYTVDHDESFGESGGYGETVETHPADETRLTESPVPARNPEKMAVQDLVPVVRSNLAGDHADGAESSRPGSVYVPEWTIHRRSRVDTPEECRELLKHLAPPAVREEMNAYDNNTAMEWAWFSIARGAMAQIDALLRFEALYDAHLALKERCEDVTRQLVSTRTDFTHVSNLYNTLSNRYQQVRGEHAGCAEKLINAERERDKLRAVNADQASHIKELEAELARKDSALVFSDRVSNERAVENERLVSKLGCLEKEKTDSIGKLLPTVVRRLLNSHEYKESLSIPFNLAIQAGWAKGLAVKRSEEDLMDVLREV